MIAILECALSERDELAESASGFSLALVGIVHSGYHGDHSRQMQQTLQGGVEIAGVSVVVETVSGTSNSSRPVGDEVLV